MAPKFVTPGLYSPSGGFQNEEQRILAQQYLLPQHQGLYGPANNNNMPRPVNTNPLAPSQNATPVGLSRERIQTLRPGQTGGIDTGSGPTQLSLSERMDYYRMTGYMPGAGKGNHAVANAPTGRAPMGGYMDNNLPPTPTGEPRATRFGEQIGAMNQGDYSQVYSGYANPQPVRTGIDDTTGRRVVQYDDGRIEYI